MFMPPFANVSSASAAQTRKRLDDEWEARIEADKWKLQNFGGKPDFHGWRHNRAKFYLGKPSKF